MASVQYLREFINERLTAAAEQIFLEFEKTIVQYEEEIDRQRRLLDITWKPEIKLHRTDVPQQPLCKQEEEEEVLPEQQLCDQERSSSVEQEEPEPPQIKEEQEELCSSQEGEQLGLKEETDTFMVTAAEEGEHSEPGGDEEQLLCHSFAGAESQDQEGGQSEASGSEIHAKTKNSANTSVTSEQAGVKKTVTCDICGKTFKFKSHMEQHYRVHTTQKPYVCQTCGKCFIQSGVLSVHMRTHTGEKPYSCERCGKRFRHKCSFVAHMRSHTGEKPYPCNVCGKRFAESSSLKKHTVIHTAEKSFLCEECGKSFSGSRILKVHLKTHRKSEASALATGAR